MKEKGLIAADLGAGSGKMCYARFDGSRLRVVEYLSFKNREINLNGNLYWDIFSLYNSIVDGIRYFQEKYKACDSFAIDTWGASYGLLDYQGRLLEPVYHYRDKRTASVMEEIFRICPARELFKLTGCQCNRSYTLPQLVASMKEGSVLSSAKSLLLLPDLLAYFLTGNISSEETIIGTSGLQSSDQRTYSEAVARLFSIPKEIYTEVIKAGSLKGKLTTQLAEYTGALQMEVVAAIGHDSASAVCAIPGFGKRKLYISIGTNVSMGLEEEAALCSDAAFDKGIKNTSGFGDKKIIYRDFSAMWHLNQIMECFRKKGQVYTIEETVRMAENVDTDFPVFDIEKPWLNTPSSDYCDRLNDYLLKKGQAPISTYAVFVRSVFESIAEKVRYYAEVFVSLGLTFDEIFLVSGGAKNSLLLKLIKQRLSPAYRIKVGLPYASLMGNLLTQLYAMEEVKDISQMRAISEDVSPMEIV